MRTRFAIASIIDSTASGVWPPFALLFLVNAQHMTETAAGMSLTAGGLIGVTTGPAIGVLLDRIGPAKLVIASNVVRLAGFLYYPHTGTVWEAVVVATVISVGDRLFWTSNAPFAKAVSKGERDLERLLGRQSIGRFAGFGLGSALIGIMPDTADPAIYNVVNYATAALLGLAAVVLLGIRTGARETTAKAGWPIVLRDRRYVAICATQILFCLASVGKYTVLPLVVINELREPQWVVAAAMITGTVVYIVVQEPVLRIAERFPRGRGMVAAAGLFAVSFTALAIFPAIPVIIATSAVMSLAECLFSPLSTAAAADAAPKEAQGRASALFQLSWGVSVALGPGLLTGLLALGTGPLWLTLAMISAAAVPAVIATQPRLRRQSAQPEAPQPPRADVQK
ncbi:MFS transporter [Kibdelosporangium phytohabitans]|uniref:MFS transporter n=1 Tax=Kibdelosporangium phytohabitans TaxID=860235 RepID=UPI0014701F9A|nr:MFS transporter [Kibdelosporangium phytohabitans]MBE1466375.1 MFS family permease [Kibdelosporangium phytohabitans]